MTDDLAAAVAVGQVLDGVQQHAQQHAAQPGDDAGQDGGGQQPGTQPELVIGRYVVHAGLRRMRAGNPPNALR
ncbi:hypothetical protein D3C72_2130940 [compost metagenome]